MPAASALELTGPQYRPLLQALLQTMDQNEFDRMLMLYLGIRRQTIAGDGDSTQVVYEVIDHFNRRGTVYKLVDAARQERPDNAVFVEYAQLLGFGPRGLPDTAALQKMVQLHNRMLHIAPFRARLGEIEGRVCRIDLRGEGLGTGFLVGPSHVLTNYHVMESCVTGQRTLQEFSCRFDYKVRDDGLRLHDGRVVEPARILAASPYDPADLVDDGTLPDPEHLDYALLELAEELGALPINAGSLSAPQRGWLALPTQPHPFAEHDPLFIVQHPQRLPMQIALNMDASPRLNGNGTRVRYTTNSEGGSSGSPCFDAEWSLVALHHAGDPAWAPAWNQGIPIAHVAAQLQARLDPAQRAPLGL